MANLHNERIIAEILESFEDRTIAEIPDVYFFKITNGMSKAMKDVSLNIWTQKIDNFSKFKDKF